MRFVIELVNEVSVQLYHLHQHLVLNVCTIKTLEQNWKHGCTSLRIKMYAFLLSFSFSPSSILGVQEPYAVSGLLTNNFEVAPRWLAKVRCNSFWCCSQLCYIVRKFLEVALVEWHAECGTVCHGCFTFNGHHHLNMFWGCYASWFSLLFFYLQATDTTGVTAMLQLWCSLRWLH